MTVKPRARVQLCFTVKANCSCYQPKLYGYRKRLNKSPKGWDAALNRTFTKTQFKTLKSGQSFYFLNTHFDHMGQQAQLQSALLLKA